MLLSCAAAVALVLSPQVTWPTLQVELEKYGVDATGLDDADRRITSDQVLNEPAWFAIAYYWDDGSSRLPEVLRVRTYDKRAKRWQHAEFKGEFGSIIRLQRTGRSWYVSGHHSPSAAPTLVLAHDLRLVRTLKGWTKLVLPDGELVYQHSMIHFAPAHPGSLGFYDPATDRDVALFPAAPVAAESKGLMVNRSFSDVALARTATITFSVEEQDVRVTPANTGEPVGAVRRLQVTCDLSAKPRCVARQREP